MISKKTHTPATNVEATAAPLSPASTLPSRTAALDVAARIGTSYKAGTTRDLSFAVRSDIGLVRTHNEDSFLAHAPLFCVCDGMGGHAAGEVASALATQTIAKNNPEHADDTLLGAAVEAANAAIIKGAQEGIGREGMGCTATAIYVENAKLAVAHVGDSRLYLLHQGHIVRVTHDHSYVEELIDAGEVTADEARIHPSRSIITRALGSDPDVYADHFSLDIEQGDRLILCSDGLSSMVTDSRIEVIAVSNVTARECTDALIAEALHEGGHDNVTVLTVDILNDGIERERRRKRRRGIVAWFTALCAVCILTLLGLMIFIHTSWYLGNNNGTVAVYRGVPMAIVGIPLSALSDTSSVLVDDLPASVQHQLNKGIPFASEAAAEAAVETYRDQIQAEKDKAATVAGKVWSGSDRMTAATAEAEAKAEAKPPSVDASAHPTAGDGHPASTSSEATTTPREGA